jgi:hypothetical protein
VDDIGDALGVPRAPDDDVRIQPRSSRSAIVIGGKRRSEMRTMLAALLGLALVAASAPAFAHVVEVTTAVSLTDVEDQETLTAAIRAAVNEAMESAVGFKPTLIALTRANVIGERLYVRLLMADAEGEEMLRDLAPDGPPSGTDDGAPAEHTYSKEPI